MRTARLSTTTTSTTATTNRMSEREAPPGRRRGYREKLETAAMLRPTGRGGAGAEPMMVHVFDLSMFGVGFSCRRSLEVGDIFRFAMCDRRQAGSRVEIRSCRQRGDGMFDIGGQFC